jgi:hypothetical protein
VKRTLACTGALLVVACGSRAHHRPVPVANPVASAPSERPTLDRSPKLLVGKLREEPYNDLPWAANALDMVEATTVSVAGRTIFVEGDPVDMVLDEIVEQQRLRRLDGLFQILKERREFWKQVNPGKPFPGVVLFRFSQRELAAVVKSVFLTAAFAGYPNASFVVNKLGGAGQGRLNADARIPLPRSSPASSVSQDARLHVDLIAVNRCRLAWKQGDSVARAVDVATGAGPIDSASLPAVQFPGLGVAARDEWRRYGAHRTATDHKFDQAHLHVPHDMEFQFIVAAIDALYEPKRPFAFNGKVEEVPSFNVTLEAS